MPIGKMRLRTYTIDPKITSTSINTFWNLNFFNAETNARLLLWTGQLPNTSTWSSKCFLRHSRYFCSFLTYFYFNPEFVKCTEAYSPNSLKYIIKTLDSIREYSIVLLFILSIQDRANLYLQILTNAGVFCTWLSLKRINSVGMRNVNHF